MCCAFAFFFFSTPSRVFASGFSRSIAQPLRSHFGVGWRSGLGNWTRWKWKHGIRSWILWGKFSSMGNPIKIWSFYSGKILPRNGWFGGTPIYIHLWEPPYMSQIPIGWLMKIEGCVYPFNKRKMMIDGIPVTGPNLFLPKGHYCHELWKLDVVITTIKKYLL